MRITLLFTILLAAAPLCAAPLVDPSPSPSAAAHLRTDKEMERAIVRALVASPNVFAAAVKVEVINRTAILRGSVRSAQEKASATEIARVTPGIRRVENRLEVRRPKRR